MRDVPPGAHRASPGLAVYDPGDKAANSFPVSYRDGAFIGQHGSGNRSAFSGHKVVFVPFTSGKPGKPGDFLTGFIVGVKEQTVYGRPAGVTVAPDGALLVAGDASDKIWRVSVPKSPGPERAGRPIG